MSETICEALRSDLVGTALSAISRKYLALTRMLRETTADHDQTHSSHNPVRLGVTLLVVAGLSLVGAGALLWSRHGAAVFVDNPVLAALAWCF